MNGPGERGDADTCLTCSDEATPARVVRLGSRGLAVVDIGGTGGTGGTGEEVSVALVDVAPGDTVLVHAKEAIAVIARNGEDGGNGGNGHA
ncbi:hypothetical protein GCM10017673_31060 [Streptosporangium violaceochromogenes]|nr:hypothetical protein GCM10017673_31060 [Streptosporangium violaceochromogenes]